MCTVIPLRITKINKDTLEVEGRKEIKKGLIKEIAVGDYVLAYANIALEKVDSKSARLMRAQFRNNSHSE